VNKRIVHIILLLVMGISLTGFTQNDSLAQVYAAEKNLKELKEEQKQLTFQKYFFEALSQKAIENYDKAIIALENCKNIDPNNTAVYFELSKNYLAQEKYVEAIAYAQKAIEKKPEEIFLLQHLKDIYVKDKNFKQALEVQQKIAIIKPEFQVDLIILYIQNNQIQNAKNLLITLEKRGLLTENLMPFKQSLFPSKIVDSDKIPFDKKTIDELKSLYSNDKTFEVLSQILTKQFKGKDYLELEKNGKEATEIFPAQPLSYLFYARALNKLKKYAAAIEVLQSGIDYVIDDYTIEADFYDQLSLGYKGLGKNVEASKYFNKAIETRQKKSQ